MGETEGLRIETDPAGGAGRGDQRDQRGEGVGVETEREKVGGIIEQVLFRFYLYKIW